ncbi:uncharacterized protein LOC114359113 [Ostrinia furnacalis]|uniref:uncharacterized protein LOC114359113 n=1 Tax=Ostrinia furnacalis TaxID=93504 RepID=UPI00103C2107|nr:uncharacterized protein LOC114359113 [Ostrinia furnacalis]
MKIFAFAFAVLLAGVAAAPETQELSGNERFVDGIIAGLIEDLSNDIKEMGLDPYILDKEEFSYRLPVTDLLEVDAIAEHVLSTGLSYIRINRISYGILTSRLQLDISLPLVTGAVGSAQARVKIFDEILTGRGGGRASIEEIRIVADVRLSIGIISGISVRSIDIDFSVGQIKSDLHVEVFGYDLSEEINNFLNYYVPLTLASNRADINHLLEHVITDLIENQL